MSQKPQTKIVTFTSMKGGVAKTSSAVTFAATAARLLGPNKVLFLDTDKQANATGIFLGLPLSNGARKMIIEDKKERPETYCLREVLLGEATLSEAIKVRELEHIPGKLNASNIHVVPSHQQLSDVTDNRRVPETRLADLVDQVKGFYALIVIDTPPDIDNKLVRSAMYVTDLAISPVSPGINEVVGVGQVTKLIQEFQSSPRMNPDIQLQVLPTMVDATTVSKSSKEMLESQFGANLLPAIPKRTAVAQATSLGMDIIEYEPDSPVSTAYGKVTIKVLKEFGLITVRNNKKRKEAVTA